jgi:MYXO-CTERM domain-containing protein
MHLFRLGEEITATAVDVCDGEATTVRITDVRSNQPDDGTGDGSTAPDVRFGSGAFCLRAEREGGVPSGRGYTVVLESTDSAGNTSVVEVVVDVPHDQRPSSRCESLDVTPVVADDDPRCEAEVVTSTSAATGGGTVAAGAPAAPGTTGGCRVGPTSDDRAPGLLLVLLGMILWRRRR